MSSPVEHARQGAVVTFQVWNRRLHFYLGLYFLFFIWLFALSGWLLNHGQWAASLGANERRETRYERGLEPLAGGTDAARARDVMRQLNLTGEINWPASQPAGSLAFNVSRPGEANDIRVDLTRNHASVRRFENSGVATFRILHTFSGSRYADTSRRDWLVTTVWVIAMDALGVGLVVMILGSYYMWWRLTKKRSLGLLALGAGAACCAAFVAGLF
jgi:hypothetical protein